MHSGKAVNPLLDIDRTGRQTGETGNVGSEDGCLSSEVDKGMDRVVRVLREI